MYNANTSPLRTYNVWNNLTYTLHTPLKHRILHANTLLKSIIRCLFILYKVRNFTYLLAYMLDQINLQTLHLFNSSYLWYVKSPRIYTAHSIQTSYFTPNALCRAHNLMSLPKVQNHIASTSKTCHFDTYPNTNSPCAHLFLLIIFESISQTSYFIPKTC